MKWLALILGMVTSLAWAGEATLTWTAPTLRTDGSAYTNPDGYRIFYWVDSQPEMVYDVTDPAVTTQTLTNLGAGLWSFQMTAYDVDGVESSRTNIVTKEILNAPPEPPGNLQVQASDLTAYTVVKRTDRFVMLPVGTVAAGTQCDPTQYVNGYFVVPRAAVSWSGSIKPDVVVAQCG